MNIKVNNNTVIVFDLDDTLYNELDFLKSAYKYIALFLDASDWQQLYAKMLSMYRCKINVFEYVANTYEIEMFSLIEMYRNHQPDIQLFDGVLEILNTIKANNGKLGIITDGRVKTQSAKLKALGIEELFDKIVISEAIGTEKPNKANFTAIEGTFTGSKYYYIADNFKKDFIAPNALGWKTIGLIDNGLNIHNNTHLYFGDRYKPNVIIESYKEIIIL